MPQTEPPAHLQGALRALPTGVRGVQNAPLQGVWPVNDMHVGCVPSAAG